jgi:hypothetical protein
MDDWWGVIVTLVALICGAGLVVYVLVNWAAAG